MRIYTPPSHDGGFLRGACSGLVLKHIFAPNPVLLGVPVWCVRSGQDFTRLVSNLYSEASTEFITPYGHTPAVGIRRGTLQVNPRLVPTIV